MVYLKICRLDKDASIFINEDLINASSLLRYLCCHIITTHPDNVLEEASGNLDCEEFAYLKTYNFITQFYDICN